MKRLSIIIVTYNSENDIYDCLDSIQYNSDMDMSEIEVIIVDNDSRECDSMFAKLRQRSGMDIKLIKNTCNGGYGQGNNVGARIAEAPVIMIMNPDVRLYEPVLNTAACAFEDDSRLCMYGMKQMLSPSLPSNHSFCFFDMMNGYLWVLLTGLFNRRDWYLPKYQYFIGACFFIRKSVFENVGMFDESFFMYGEEDDLHYKVVKKYGPYISYNKNLHYVHLTQFRAPDINYEIKLLDVTIRRQELIGYSKRKILKNYLRRVNVQLLRENVRSLLGKSNDRLIMLREFRNVIKNRLDEK